METDAPLAPPVVAVVVVHRPGPWFVETLESLADQDYPNLDTLFLLAGEPVDAEGNDLHALVTAHLPDAFVRELGANPGFGVAANEVLNLVEGDSGFFCVCHDDVALEPGTIRALVEELYRSNAGLVGPKLVSWDDPGVLQHVGLGLDRFGEIDPITEPGEYDQEQHDSVRDVFVLPSACLLVRADLFRTLGGFDAAISFYGDDVDLCWRAHLSGARVIVAPQARVRHREELTVRRPDLNHETLRARHRMRSVATLTSGARLPVRSIELAVLSVTELFVGLFTARLGEAWSSLRAFVGLVPRAPSLLARRSAVAKLRRVDDAEIIDLQVRGSARLTRYRRAHDTETFIGVESTVRRWRENPLGSVIAWVLVVAFVIIASRTMFNTRVPNVGEFLPLPASPRDWWGDFTSAWNPGGLGATVATPTGWGVLSLASVLWLFHQGLGLTVLVVGLVLLGIWGAWRLATVFPANRARIATLVVYAALPLLPGVISTGRLTALVAYAAVPWFVHLLRTAVGIGTADPAAAAGDLVDGILVPSPRERIRRTAMVAIAVALAVALAPPVLPVLVLVAIVLGVTTLAAFAGWRTAAWMTGLGLAACAAGWLLNLPWSATWTWSDLSTTPLAGAPGESLSTLAAMDIGRGRFSMLTLALYLPVVIALLVARAWRLTWAARAAGLVVVFLGLVVLQDTDALPFQLPDIGVLLVPVGLGIAISAGSSVAAFGADVAGRDFGWRQPLGVVALVAVVIGVVPALFTLTDGAWYAPRVSMTEAVEVPLPTPSEVGSYRVMYLGDPRVIPFPTEDLGDGVAMAVVGDGRTDSRDRWAVVAGPADPALRDAVEQIAAGSTRRAGRLLAPFGIRYVVVPAVNGTASTADDPLPLPAGLVDALGAQLDLVRSHTPPSFVRFENASAIPVTAQLPAAVAEAAASPTVDVLVGVDTSGATPVFDDVAQTRAATGEVAAGSVGLATPDAANWDLTVGGQSVAAREAFGVATVFDTGAAGPGDLRYGQPTSRTTWLILLGLLWLAVLVAASRVSIPSRLRMRRAGGAALIDLDAGPAVPPPSATGDRTGFGGWVDEVLADEPGPIDAPPAVAPALESAAPDEAAPATGDVATTTDEERS